MRLFHYELTDEELEISFERRQFHAIYQPIVCWKTNKVVAVETFSRWNHPFLGILPPSLFLQRLHNSEQRQYLLRHILRCVFDSQELWQQKGCPIHVNLSSPEVINPGVIDILEGIASLVHEHGIQIRLEISPDFIFCNNKTINTDKKLSCDEKERLEQIRPYIERYRSMGYDIVMDSVSVLSKAFEYAQYLGIKIVKIKQSIINQMIMNGNSAFNEDIVAIVKEARKQGIQFVPVGIENVGQLKMAYEIGLDWIQGFFIAPPLAAEEIKTWEFTGFSPDVMNILTLSERMSRMDMSRIEEISGLQENMDRHKQSRSFLSTRDKNRPLRKTGTFGLRKQ